MLGYPKSYHPKLVAPYSTSSNLDNTQRPLSRPSPYQIDQPLACYNPSSSNQVLPVTKLVPSKTHQAHWGSRPKPCTYPSIRPFVLVAQQHMLTCLRLLQLNLAYHLRLQKYLPTLFPLPRNTYRIAQLTFQPSQAFLACWLSQLLTNMDNMTTLVRHNLRYHASIHS